MVMVSTLTAAAELWHAARERRAGRDPSEQEAGDVVRPFLEEAASEIEGRAMLLQHAAAFSPHGETVAAGLVRRFDDLLTTRSTAGLLQVVHQRLLSLYPEVDESLAEAARRLYAEGAALLEADDAVFDAACAPYARRLLAFANALRRALGTSA